MDDGYTIVPNDFFRRAFYRLQWRMQQLLSRREKKNEEPIYFAKDLQAMYTVFRDQIHNPASVLYPSCGFDASPTRVFNNVTFVDKEEGNEGCVAKLQEAGFHALKMDIR